MVKAVQAEEAVEAHFDALLKARAAAEVGLLIGKPAVGSRDLVLAVVPTPSADDERPVLSLSAAAAGSARGGSAGKSGKGARGGAGAAGGESTAVSIELDGEGVAEHALQAALMLPGGLAVLGLYLFAPESGYASCSGQLASTLGTIAADAAAAAAPAATGTTAAASASASPAAPQQQELLLLHVDSATRKFSMRSCLASAGAGAAAASLKPAELKFGPCLSSLVALRTRHAFDVSLPATSSAAELQQLLQDTAAAEARRVASALALLGGAAPAGPSTPLAELLPPSASGVTGGGHSLANAAWVDLFCAPPAAAAGSGSSKGSSSGDSSGKGGKGSSASAGAAATTTAAAATAPFAGSCRLQGCIEALSYAHRRDAAAKALAELKQDVSASLAARLVAISDHALAAAADAADAADAGEPPQTAAAPAHPMLASAGSAGKTLCALPRRVLLPWAALGGLQVAAYLSDDQGPAAAVEHAQQLLPLPDLQASQVQELEAPAVHKGLAVAGGSSSGAGAGGGVATCGPAVAAAAAAGAVAAVSVALAFLNLGQQ